MPFITKENVHKWLEIDGYENYVSAIARGKGILSIVAHLGTGSYCRLPILFLPNNTYCLSGAG